jgi:hypothetical protein
MGVYRLLEVGQWLEKADLGRNGGFKGAPKGASFFFGKVDGGGTPNANSRNGNRKETKS